MKTYFSWMYSSAAFLLLAASCSTSNVGPETDPLTTDKIVLDQNAGSLDKRVSHKNAGLLNFKTTSASGAQFKSGQEQQSTILSDGQNDFALALISEIESPVFEGQKLRSTHVAVAGNYAYVSYNTEGDKYLGGIDVIDISDKHNPRLTLSAKLPNVDVNALQVDGNKLLIAGAVDRDVYYDLESSAWASYLNINNGVFGNDYDFTSLKGPVAMDIIAGKQGSNYVVSAGKGGALSKLNKTSGKVELSVEIPDLRSVKENGSKVVVLSGAGSLQVYNQSLELEKEIAVKQSTADAKRTMDLVDNMAILPQGKDGFSIYNIQSASLVNQYAMPKYTGNDATIDPEDIVVNAVSVNKDRLFTANGGAGIAVYDYKNANGLATLLGTASFDGLERTSSNFVVSNDNYVFVASGRGGLKILNMVKLTPEPESTTCTGNYPSYIGPENLNLNSNEIKYYSGAYTFKGANIGGSLTWCGAMSVLTSDLNINSNGSLYVYGSLAANGNMNVNEKASIYGSATVTGNLHINNNGILKISGNLAQGSGVSKTTLHINGKLEIEGTVIVYGDLNMNSQGSVEFKDADSRLIVYGEVTNNGGKVISGSIEKIK